MKIKLHRQLCTRRIKRDESVQEYFLASRGNIETAALIQYVCDVVPDDTYRKTL